MWAGLSHPHSLDKGGLRISDVLGYAEVNWRGVPGELSPWVLTSKAAALCTGRGCVFLWLRGKPGHFRQWDVAKPPAFAATCCRCSLSQE